MGKLESSYRLLKEHNEVSSFNFKAFKYSNTSSDKLLSKCSRLWNIENGILFFAQYFRIESPEDSKSILSRITPRIQWCFCGWQLEHFFSPVEILNGLVISQSGALLCVLRLKIISYEGIFSRNSSRENIFMHICLLNLPFFVRHFNTIFSTQSDNISLLSSSLRFACNS